MAGRRKRGLSGGGAGAGRCWTPNPPCRAVASLVGPAAAAGAGGGAGSAPPRSPGNKGPPPPRAGRDLPGQRGAERPDAGGARGRAAPRARFLHVSSPRALRVPARARPPAGRSLGRVQRGLGIKGRFLHPRQPSRRRRLPPGAAPTQPLVEAGRSATPPWLRALRPVHLRFFWRVGRRGGMEGSESTTRHPIPPGCPPELS